MKLATVLAGLLLIAAAAQAQDKPAAAQKRDGDGRISRAEFTAIGTGEIAATPRP